MSDTNFVTTRIELIHEGHGAGRRSTGADGNIMFV